MIPRLAMALVPCLLLCTGGARAQDLITIKVKESATGDVCLIKSKVISTQKVKVTGDLGAVLSEEKLTTTGIEEFTETTLQQTPGKPASKIKRQYHKVQTVTDGETETGPLEGKTVLIEKKKKRYRFTYEDGEKVTGAGADALASEFNAKGDAAFDDMWQLAMPKQPVKVGEPWKLDMSRFAKGLKKAEDLALDGAKATGSGTLVKVYEKGATRFGELRIKIEAPLLSTIQGGDKLTFEKGAVIVFEITYDMCIDGTSLSATQKAKTSVTGRASLKSMPGVYVSLNIVEESFDSFEELPKK